MVVPSFDDMPKPLKVAMGLSVPCSILIAGIYQVTFWGRFGVSPFDFIGFADVLPISVVPLAGIVIGAVIGILIDKETDPPAGTEIKNPRIQRFLRRRGLTFALALTIAAALAFWQLSSPLNFFVAVFLGLSALASASEMGALVAILPSSFARRNLLICLFFFPAAAYTIGNQQADALLHKKNDVIADAASLGLDPTSDANVAYIGRLGSYFFFRDQTKGETVAVRQEELKRLVFVGQAAGAKRPQ